MALPNRKTKEIITSIDQLIQPKDQRYGRLLNWQNPGDPFWHYGIGLSNTHIFDTGKSWIGFRNENAKLVIGCEDIHLDPSEVMQRLRKAICVFADWEYNFVGWNCEHLARLITTDQARSYQSQPIWFLCNLTGKGDHKTAKQVFDNYPTIFF
ncbi:hypothetical protein [Picosynechococcus sp. PCC 73109]|uniref:hypothetical protein n=1 Tax=Picosynechococcus sp. PCC 73109 TaxID=374982 RepID=UPI0007458933|nr:hypothetical protein [Picosynechococcus sp. PCC 73109]AMA07837.1 hypothetical protein AWQ23_00060 [Picosynechococcus sp. PCC 73109]